MSTTSDTNQVLRAVSDNGIPFTLALIAFGGSFDHWTKLASHHGQPGILAPLIAVCVDLGVLMAARERQRDIRTGRKRRGWVSWPTIVMAFGIGLTLAGNLAGAQSSAWGYISAAIPGLFLMLAISLMERRAAESARRAVAGRIAAEAEALAARQRAEAEERAERGRLAAEAEAERQAARAERERQAAEELAERQRQADAAEEERQRQAEAERQRQADERRLAMAERQAAIARADRRPIAGPSRELAITAGQCIAPGPAGSNTGAAKVMRAHWDREVAAGRPAPSGAELLDAAGLAGTKSSLGRQMRAKWLPELDEMAPETEGADA